MAADSDLDMWIFGYGSLIWKTNFPYKEKVAGQIRGFARIFWQGSTDHRGIPGKEHVTGVAFKVGSSDKDNVIKYLDYREKGGYQLAELLFHPNDECRKPYNVLVYMATKQNPNYLGPAPEKQIAEQIVSSVGPSGPNLEYFDKLVESLEQIGTACVDGHLRRIKSYI